jgi:protein-disulfide isomerase
MTPAATESRGPRPVGVIVVLFVVALLIAGFASLSLDDGEVEPIRITGAGEVQQLLGGVEQKGATLGDPDAPVTIDLFNDLSCEPCGEYQLEVVPKLVENYVRPGKAQLKYRHFATGQRTSSVADFAALAAAQQDYQWQYLQLFFLNQDEAKRVGITDEFLDDIAGGMLQMDTEQWREDFDAPEVQATIDSDNAVAIDLELPAEPAVVVTGPRGTRQLDESPAYDEIVKAIGEVS